MPLQAVEIARQQMEAFRETFGRDPGPAIRCSSIGGDE